MSWFQKTQEKTEEKAKAQKPEYEVSWQWKERLLEAAKTGAVRIALENEHNKSRLKEMLAEREKMAKEKAKLPYEVETGRNGKFIVIGKEHIPVRYIASVVVKEKGSEPALYTESPYPMLGYGIYGKCAEVRDVLNAMPEDSRRDFRASKNDRAAQKAEEEAEVPLKKYIQEHPALILIETSAGRQFFIQCPDVHLEQVCDAIHDVWTS